MRALHYRRGFLRLYAIFVGLWIAALLFVLPSSRLKFWLRPIDDSYETRLKESKAIGATTKGYVLTHTLEWSKQHQGTTGKSPNTLPADFFHREQEYVALGKKVKARFPASYDDLEDAYLGVLTAAKYPDALKPGPLPNDMKPDSPSRKDDWLDVEPIKDWFGANAPDMPKKPGFAESPIGKSLWLLAVLFGVSLVGYAILFGLIPWVYRGFKPTPQSTA
jgi:hypothetical protein